MGALKKQKIRDGKYAGRPATPTAKVGGLSGVPVRRGPKLRADDAAFTLALFNNILRPRRKL